MYGDIFKLLQERKVFLLTKRSALFELKRKTYFPIFLQVSKVSFKQNLFYENMK